MERTKFNCCVCDQPVMADDDKAYIRRAFYDGEREFVECVCGRCPPDE